VQIESVAQLFVAQVAPEQMPALVPQFVSRLHAPAEQWPAVHVPVVPHCAFVVQSPALQTPFTEPDVPVPQRSESHVALA
jgi:hypothetical protein